MSNKENNSLKEYNPQGIMKNNLNSICETIQNMEMKIEGYELKSQCLKNSVSQKLAHIKAGKNQQFQISGNLNSLKGIVDGLKCLQQNMNVSSQSLRDNSDQYREKIFEEERKQVYNMECFEENVFNMAQQFEEGPQAYSTCGLMEGILALKEKIHIRDEELAQFREVLEEFDLKYCNYSSCNDDLKTALNVFETSYGGISTETKKLSSDLDKLNASLQNLRQELVMLKSQHS